MSCESSIADLTMDMFEEEDCKDQLLSQIKELHEAVTAMKGAFTEAQKQLEDVQGDDGKLKEEIETNRNQCQQQSSEILRLILTVQTELGSVKEMVTTSQLMQHGLQTTIHSLLLDRDFLLDELAKSGAISEGVRGRLHTRLNTFVGRPSSGSQSTNDSGVACLGEGSNKSTTGSQGQSHAQLTQSISNDIQTQAILHSLHHGTNSPYPPRPGSNAEISAAEHHLLSHHHPPTVSHHNLISPHVQDYLNSHSQFNHHRYHHGEMLPSMSPSGAGPSGNPVGMQCCCPSIPPPPPIAYATELGPVYDSDSSLTLAAAKSLSLSNSLSKQCGLELDQQQLLDEENKKKGRRNSSSNDSTSNESFKETGKNNSGRTCDVTNQGSDPSYNSDGEFVDKQGNTTSTMLSFKENQRMKVAKELLETERKYCDTLKTIQETFALPLKNSGILSLKDINTLFPEEVFKLYEKHCDLLAQLEERVISWKTKPTVGDLLERFINGEDSNVLRLYTSYVNDFPEVLKTFHKLCRSSTDFTRFLKSTLEHPTCGGLDLGAFLLTPVQRMPRYILLLKQMMKFTDANHPDYKNISVCLNRLREYLKRLNDSMEHSFQLVTAQISPQPHEPLLEKLMGFGGKGHFARASTSSQSSNGEEQILHKVRYKRSTSVPRSSHSTTSETGKSQQATAASGGHQKESKSKLKSRSKSEWTVCNNNEDENHGHKCRNCNCTNSTGNVPNKLNVDSKRGSRYDSKKNIFERTLSDSDINSGDEGSLEENKDSRKFSTSKSLHDFNQDDIDETNLEWFISEPSLCEMKHGMVNRSEAITPDYEEDTLTRTSSSLRRNMMIRPVPNPSRVVARLTRATESEMNLHMLEKSEVKSQKKSKMSLRNSLKNIFSIKKRYKSGGKHSESTSALTTTACSTTSTTISTATATANYRVVYTDGGNLSEQRVALLKNMPGCLVSTGTSFTASTTNINNICNSSGHVIPNCSGEVKPMGISPLLQYLHRMPSYLELIMFSVRETTV